MRCPECGYEMINTTGLGSRILSRPNRYLCNNAKCPSNQRYRSISPKDSDLRSSMKNRKNRID